MKNLKNYAIFLLMLAVCMSLMACGEAGSNEGENSEEISIEDLDGFWYPVEGIGSTTSILTCIYLDGTAGTWEEYDQYGNPTEYTGSAYIDGTVLTLSDVPLIEEVDIPIGDSDTLLTDTGETYWIKGAPDFQEKPDFSAYVGRWYYKGDQDSEFASATTLTLNEDGTYTKGGEEGTYTYQEYDNFTDDAGNTEFRQEITLSGGFMDENYFLADDGQVLVYWSDDGDNYYIYEDALENEQLLAEYKLTDGSFWGEKYALQFKRGNALLCSYFNDANEARNGTWQLSGDTVTIFWDDGETDEATLNLSDKKILQLNSTGETLENSW